MKFGALSDLHGILPEIKEECDIYLICGDITPLKMQRNIPQSKKWLSHEFAQWVKDLPCEKVFMVGGNHDFALASIYQNTLSKNSLLYTPTDGKLVMLDNESYTYIDYKDGTEYTIWGTPYCKIFGNWAYMYEEKTLIEAYSTMPEHCDIVISHDAPMLCGLGVIHQSWTREDVGNPWLADEIMRKHPKYAFCGHIHSGEHRLMTLDDMKMANVSLVDERYIQSFEPLIIEL